MVRSVGGKPPPPPDLPVVGASSTAAGDPTFAAAGVPFPATIGAFSASAGAPPSAGGAPIPAAGGVVSPPARAPDLVGSPPHNPQVPCPAAAGALPGLVGAPLHFAAAVLGEGHAGPSSVGGLGGGKGVQQAHPAAGGGEGTRQGTPTFAQLFARSPPLVEIPVSVHPPAATDRGIPAAFFSKEEVQISVGPLDLAIMAKTPQGRPPFPLIRDHLAQRFNFQQDFLIAPYDGRHLLIKLGCKDDYLKMLLKASILVQDKPFWFSKWTMEFSPEADSPLVPVWLELPRLPANFYFQPMLRSIAGSIGSVLQIAPWTLHMTRVHAAAVCVQLDVSQPLPDRVWVGIGGGGFMQPIVYPNPPKFCSKCLRLGHLAHDCRNGVPPSDTHGHSKGAVRGNEQDRNTPAPNATWRPVAEKPAAAQPARLKAHGKNAASKVFDKLPEHGLASDPKIPVAQVQAQGVYLTPPKPPLQMRTPGVPAKISASVVSTGGGCPANQQKQKQPPHHDQLGASLVLDAMPQSVDQLHLNPNAPAASVLIPMGMSHNLNSAVRPPQHRAGTSQAPEETDQQLGSTPKDSGPDSGGGSPAHQHQDQVAASQVFGLTQSLDQLSLKEAPAVSVRTPVGLSPKLNPAAPAWTPSVHERGDIDLPDEFPSLPPAARSEQTRSSARGKKPVQPAQQPPDLGFITLPITHDVMCFPGIPEPAEDFVPKMHSKAQSSKSDAQGSGGTMMSARCNEPGLSTAPNPDASLISSSTTSDDKGSDKAKVPDELPHTPAAREELTPVLSSPHQGRVSFTTAIRRKLRASDTRRTERALEESDEPSSGSSSEEEDPPDPPPPPPKLSDWVQAVAPGKMIIGLPASQNEAEPSKLPDKEEELIKMPVRQTRQTLRRGFL